MEQSEERIKIEGKRIFLRTLNERDATKEYCSWLNDPEVNKYLETKKATIPQLKEYIKERNKKPNCLFLGIFFKENRKPRTRTSSVRGRHIGNIKLEPINFKEKKAAIGILIGDKGYWGKGIGTEAVKLLVDYGFKKLNLKEINLGVISENKAAIKVYQKVGFEIKKIEKKAIRHGRKLFDKVTMSVKNEGKKLEEQIIDHVFKFSLGTTIKGVGQFINQYFAAFLLGPTTFGVWQGVKLILSYGGCVGLGAMEGLHREIPFLKGKGRNKEIFEMKDTPFIFYFVTTTLLSFLILLSTFFFNLNPEVILALRFISLILFTQIFKTFYESWLKANSKFDTMSKIAVIDGVGLVVSVILIFFLGFFGFLLGFTLSILASTIYAYFKSNCVIKLRWDLKILKKLITIGFPIMLIGIVGALFQTIDRFLILRFLNAKSLGLYSLGWLAFMPLTFVFYSANSVMFPRFAERFGKTGKDADLKNFIILPIKTLALIIPVLIGAIVVILPILVRFFLPEYTEGIEAARILLFGLFFAYVVGMAGNFFLVTNRQYFYLGILVGGILMNLILSTILIKFGLGIMGVAIGTSVSYLLFFVVMIITLIDWAFETKKREMGKFFFEILAPISYVIVLSFLITKLINIRGLTSVDLLKSAILKEFVFLVFSSYLIFSGFKSLEIKKYIPILWKK